MVGNVRVFWVRCLRGLKHNVARHDRRTLVRKRLVVHQSPILPNVHIQRRFYAEVVVNKCRIRHALIVNDLSGWISGWSVALGNHPPQVKRMRSAGHIIRSCFSLTLAVLGTVAFQWQLVRPLVVINNHLTIRKGC